MFASFQAFWAEVNLKELRCVIAVGEFRIDDNIVMLIFPLTTSRIGCN